MNLYFSGNVLVHFRRLIKHLYMSEEQLEGIEVASNPSHQFQNIIFLTYHVRNVILECIMKVHLHGSIEFWVTNASLKRRCCTILDCFDIVLATLFVIGFKWQVGCCRGFLPRGRLLLCLTQFDQCFDLCNSLLVDYYRLCFLIFAIVFCVIGCVLRLWRRRLISWSLIFDYQFCYSVFYLLVCIRGHILEILFSHLQLLYPFICQG